MFVKHTDGPLERGMGKRSVPIEGCGLSVYCVLVFFIVLEARDFLFFQI